VATLCSVTGRLTRLANFDSNFLSSAASTPEPEACDKQRIRTETEEAMRRETEEKGMRRERERERERDRAQRRERERAWRARVPPQRYR